MRFVKCGSKLFDPKAVTAVHLDHMPSQIGHAGPPEVWVVVPGDILVFRGEEAKAVREFFLSQPATDLMQRLDVDETGAAVAANHSQGEC